MSHTLHGENVAAFTQGRAFSGHVLFARLTDTLRTWRRRQRERQELLYYLATDHRAVMDLGTDFASAREWADRPFWQG